MDSKTKGLLIYFGLVVIGLILVWLWDEYGPDDDPPTTPPGFRWGD